MKADQRLTTHTHSLLEVETLMNNKSISKNVVITSYEL